MDTQEIAALAARHGAEAAEHYWQLDPADHELAAEWVRNAEAGTLRDHYTAAILALEELWDEIPCDLDTEGWSWGELADYQGACEAAFLARTTELCREMIA
jgi:hypothetical protein